MYRLINSYGHIETGMGFPTVINRNSQFLFYSEGMPSFFLFFLLLCFYFFYLNFNRRFYKQIMETLVRRRVVRRLIWFYTV